MKQSVMNLNDVTSKNNQVTVVQSSFTALIIFALALLIFTGCGENKVVKKIPIDQTTETNTQNPSDSSATTDSQAQNNQSNANLRVCTNDEFSKLSSGMNTLDLALRQISALDAWKYDRASIAQATKATQACENLMAYHKQNPCKKTVTQNDGSRLDRIYTNDTLATRCEKARLYHYDFFQNRRSLNFNNADLYVDLSTFPTRFFEKDYINEIQMCRVENISGRDLTYDQPLALVKSSRGFEAKMMVLETREGLLIQCYGLSIGEAFSKTEIERVLKADGSNIRLVYRLKN